MKKVPKISDAEWEVMKVLWAAEGPQPASIIVEQLEPRTDWKPKTIMTLINRLVKKAVLGYEKEGRVFYYYPLYKESECQQAESRSFLQRVYDGSVTPMLANFLEGADLSKGEIEELKRILDERGK